MKNSMKCKNCNKKLKELFETNSLSRDNKSDFFCRNVDCHLYYTGLEEIKTRIEEIRKAMQDENVSYGEIAELQGLVGYIDESDVELLELAGVPEK